MNELHFAYQIRQHLNRGLQQIDDNQLARLAKARETALAAQRKPARVPALAAAGHFLRFHTEQIAGRRLFLALTAALAMALYAHWHAEGLISELSDVDSALLADEMPVEALIDEDFESWLHDS